MRFTIRDLLWLMVAAGMALGWWLERSRATANLEDAVIAVAEQWAKDVGHPVSFVVPGPNGFHDGVGIGHD
jgi:hypothetical protein